jgi:hypothetical protein
MAKSLAVTDVDRGSIQPCKYTHAQFLWCCWLIGPRVAAGTRIDINVDDMQTRVIFVRVGRDAAHPKHFSA